MRFDFHTLSRATPLGALIYDSGGNILGDTGHAESVPPDLASGISEGRYFVAVDTGLPGNGPQPGDWLSSLTAVIPKMAAFVAAEDFARVNANRAKAGLPAVRVLNYGPQCGLSGTDTRRGGKPAPSRKTSMQLSRTNYLTFPPGTQVFQDPHARRLGSWVQNPETGEWYDDGTGGGGLVGAPPSDVPGSLPGATGSGPSDWLESIASALPKVSAFLTAEQLAQVNVDRAKKGLPALQTSQYAPQVGVGLDPGTSKLIMMVGAGLAAVILVPKLLRSRRRSR